MPSPCTALPPGFRFHPTDEELILHYLRKRAAAAPCPAPVIAEVDIYKLDPWDLPAKAVFGEGEWYFFSPRDRKYPNGVRPNRAAGSGYWKATGTDKPITLSSAGTEMIGVKKVLVFYKGRPPKGTKTNWIMHEYRLADALTSAAANTYIPMRFKADSSMRLDDLVLCRIYKRTNQLLEPSSMDGLGQQQDDVVATYRMPKPPSIPDYYLEDYSAVSELFENLPETDRSGRFFITTAAGNEASTHKRQMDDSNNNSIEMSHASKRLLSDASMPINTTFSIFGPGQPSQDRI